MQLPTDRADYSKWIEYEDPETGEVFRVQVHNSEGAEIPDPIPMAPPVGYDKPLSMFDQHRAMIRAEHTRLRELELEQLQETREQANDFEVNDDVEDQPSLYEEKFDPVDFEVRNRLRQEDHRRKVKARIDGLPEEQRELLNGDSLNTGAVYERGESDLVGRDDVKSGRSKSKPGKDKASGVSDSVRSGDRGNEEGVGEGSGG